MPLALSSTNPPESILMIQHNLPNNRKIVQVKAFKALHFTYL